MARFLLIHGAGHGTWCWTKTIPALQALGHDALAIDLPSHGDDPTPVGEVTLEAYGAAITEALARLDGPAIVVGHSMGGYAITQAAEMDPSRITRLVYLCAYTPWPGLSLAEMRHQADVQPLLPAIQMRADGLSFTFDPEMAPELFYHDCAPDDVAFALSRINPQSVQPSSVPVALTERSQDLPRSYIVCTQDHTIPLSFQRKMAARTAPQDVYTLESSHSPFLSMPDALATCLHQIAT
ncbi:MAG: alpha/beta fold hydrolase [Paracoccaceae bacterium]|nr:alpha/beta fold hydrolase [Paracoccaceae bacterium]